MIIKFANGYTYEDWMYYLIALASAGKCRVSISFSSYIGRNSHHRRKLALLQKAKQA